MDPAVLDHFRSPGRHTGIGGFAPSPPDLAAVVETVRSALVYDLMADGLYGLTLDAEQSATIHRRDAAAVLSMVAERGRVGGRCHTYALLTVALCRAVGLPARSRCGFASYFLPADPHRGPAWEDHWVAEVWDEQLRRWRRVDAQLDDTWRRLITFEADPLDLPAGAYIDAGAAWQAWRRNELDAGRCGLSAIDEHGSHWIAGNLRLDLAALAKVEMLPWDVWGAGWEVGEQPTAEMLGLFDRVAELATDVDRRLPDALALFGDDRLRVPGEVFNAQRGVTEAVA